jgi:hypothetical protein
VSFIFVCFLDECLTSNRELKSEAQRIRVFDHAGTPYFSRPARPVDYPKIDADVLDALKYLQCAAFAMQQPRLRQDTGIFVSDGAIPKSLHREVSELIFELPFFQLNHLAACDRIGCAI